MKDKLLCFISMSLAILYCFGLITTVCGVGVASSDDEAGNAEQSTGLAMEYETRIFDTSTVHTIDIMNLLSVYGQEHQKYLCLNVHSIFCTVKDAMNQPENVAVASVVAQPMRA